MLGIPVWDVSDLRIMCPTSQSVTDHCIRCIFKQTKVHLLEFTLAFGSADWLDRAFFEHLLLSLIVCLSYYCAFYFYLFILFIYFINNFLYILYFINFIYLFIFIYLEIVQHIGQC